MNTMMLHMRCFHASRKVSRKSLGVKSRKGQPLRPSHQANVLTRAGNRERAADDRA